VLVHSKLRNHLGIEESGKLVFLFKLLNRKPVDNDDDDDDDCCLTISSSLLLQCLWT